MSKNELRHFEPKHFISVPPLFEIVAKAMITRRYVESAIISLFFTFQKKHVKINCLQIEF